MMTYGQPLNASPSTVVVLVEIVGIRLERSKKARDPMEVQLDRSTEVMPVQFRKALSPMEVQSDRSTEVMLVQFQKAEVPMEVIPDRLNTPSVSLLKVLRLLQPEKQFIGMVLILLDHVTLVMPWQLVKAKFPMKLQLDRSIEPVMLEQAEKALFQMELQPDRLTEIRLVHL